MATLEYHGKNGNPALDYEKIESLRIQNEISRTKLGKLQGELVSKREVSFVVAYALTTLREHILRVPQLVSADLRGLDLVMVHGIRMRVDESVRRWLEELAETLCQAANAKDFFVELERDDDAVETESQKEARERKKDAANAKRREKWQAKQKD
jgi:hypothetical protein